MRKELINAIVQEIKIRKDYLGTNTLKSIYFGGGTPSLLSIEEVYQIFNVIKSHFHIQKNAEITFEANPENVNQEYLSKLKQLGVNRISLGIQSFFDEDLHLLGRVHNADEAIRSAETVRKEFENMTIDLIYGIQSGNNNKWLKNLSYIKQLSVPHFSAYALTIEPKTVMDSLIRKGKIEPPNENAYAAEYNLLCQFAGESGYKHYELSNFSQPGFSAIHNSSYWKGEEYLGVGPAAHSYDGSSRQWNVSNNPIYIKKVMNKDVFHEEEKLTEADRFNEYILTALRTSTGVDLAYVSSKFGEAVKNHLQYTLKSKSNKPSWFNLGPHRISLTEEGMFFSDHIISSLFLIDDEINEKSTY